MTWVIDQVRVAYKACWTSAANVEAFVERFLGTGEGTGTGTGEGVGTGTGNDRPYGTSGVYKTEQLELRQLDRNSFMNRLLRNGPRAATEFREAQRLWSQRA